MDGTSTPELQGTRDEFYTRSNTRPLSATVSSELGKTQVCVICKTRYTIIRSLEANITSLRTKGVLSLTLWQSGVWTVWVQNATATDGLGAVLLRAWSQVRREMGGH